MSQNEIPTQLKLVIPLVEPELEYDDLSDECGFVGAYACDLNRPSLDSHIFLMYRLEPMTESIALRIERFAKFKNVYSKKIVYIDNKPYEIYAFPLLKVTWRQLKNGYRAADKDELKRILVFWKYGYDVAEFYLHGTINGRFEHKCVPKYTSNDEYEIPVSPGLWDDSVPEYDFRSYTSMMLLKKKAGLHCAAPLSKKQ